jgi:3-phosphoshikimate 1-carboxyvinyltransferase
MSEFTYPAELPITPLTTAPNSTVTVPGSKSITNRALVLAALGSWAGGTTLRGALRSEDTEVMVACLERLGFLVEVDWAAQTINVSRADDPEHIPSGGYIPNPEADLFVANSGTTIRFLTAMVALGHGTYRFDGIPRMRERPIGDLLDALNQLGTVAHSESKNGCPPVVVRASGLHGGHVRIKANVSSQFLSGLMQVLPFADEDTLIEIDGTLVSEPYVEMTIGVMQSFGLRVLADGPGKYRLPGRQRHGLAEYQVEPDASSASYFLAVAAITGGTVGVLGLTAKSLQGDVRFADALGEMGCTVIRGDDRIAVTGGPLRGIDVDMNDISDTVMTLAAVACFAEGPTTIRNVGHIRHKETDRIAAVATELRKLGAEVDEFPDGLKITPPTGGRALTGCAVDTYNDHRMAMSLALVGLKVPGVVIRNPGCVAKTYPGFWQDLEKLRG